MNNFMSQWYSNGIETDPPPCLKSKIIYCICSGNIGCYYLGLMGNQWGANHRSQILFVAFWLSLIGLILILAALACISANVPYFQGTLEIVQGSVTSKVNYYAGIARVVFSNCDGASCPPSSISWGDSSCDTYFQNCNKCEAANPGTIAYSVAMAIFGQLGQLAADLYRSTATHDLHCQKFVAIFSFFLGVYGILSTLNTFGNTCMDHLQTQPGVTTSLTKHTGATLILLALAMLLKVVDCFAHIMVPVPKLDFWTPETAAKMKAQNKTTEETRSAAGAKGEGHGYSIYEAQQKDQEMVNPVWLKSEVKNQDQFKCSEQFD